MQGDHVTGDYRVYGYRWVVLAVFMLVNLAIQMLWISYAPITSDAAKYYGVSELAIGLLAMTFMIAFIPLSMPAAWVIDTRGFRLAVGFGVVLMAIFGITRGLAGSSYTLVLLSTIGLAIAQPFLARCLDEGPRQLVRARRARDGGRPGHARQHARHRGGHGAHADPGQRDVDCGRTAHLRTVRGCQPRSRSSRWRASGRRRRRARPGMEERALMLDGLKHALTVKPFLVMLGVAFIVMSAFNGVTTWVEEIIKPRGFTSTEAGIMGGLMLIAGIIGAVVLSALSDRQGKRIRFMVIALVATVPGMLGVAFVSSAVLLYAFAAVLGFFLVAVLPIGMQYAAEITNPTPEGTSNGLIQLCGQVSVVSVYVMAALRTSNGSFTVSLLLAAVLLVACALAVSRLKDAAPAAVHAGTVTTVADVPHEGLGKTVSPSPAGD